VFLICHGGILLIARCDQPHRQYRACSTSLRIFRSVHFTDDFPLPTEQCNDSALHDYVNGGDASPCSLRDWLVQGRRTAPKKLGFVSISIWSHLILEEFGPAMIYFH